MRIIVAVAVAVDGAAFGVHVVRDHGSGETVNGEHAGCGPGRDVGTGRVKGQREDNGCRQRLAGALMRIVVDNFGQHD